MVRGVVSTIPFLFKCGHLKKMWTLKMWIVNHVEKQRKIKHKILSCRLNKHDLLSL